MDDVRRTEVMNFRLTIDERARVLRRAKERELGVSEFIRSLVLNEARPQKQGVSATVPVEKLPQHIAVQSPPIRSGPTEPPSKNEIKALARRRYPHLPLVRAEAKVRAELDS